MVLGLAQRRLLEIPAVPFPALRPTYAQVQNHRRRQCSWASHLCPRTTSGHHKSWKSSSLHSHHRTESPFEPVDQVWMRTIRIVIFLI